MTPDPTREQMIEAIIKSTYENMDFDDLYNYVEFYEQRQYADWTDEQIEYEYQERLQDNDE